MATVIRIHSHVDLVFVVVVVEVAEVQVHSHGLSIEVQVGHSLVKSALAVQLQPFFFDVIACVSELDQFEVPLDYKTSLLINVLDHQ